MISRRSLITRSVFWLSRAPTVSSRRFGTSARKEMARNVAERGKEAGVEFYQFSFVDLFGVQRSKLVPASRVEDTIVGGAGFAGFAAHLDVTPADGDTLAMADPESFTVLPWEPKVGWLSCDLQLNGAPLAHGPRNVMKQTLRKLSTEHGITLKTGVECEFFLLDAEGTDVADALDSQAKPCYDAHALMRRFTVISELMRNMERMGWGPYQADHEDANGQFEINWDFDDALKTADRVVFFKYMTRSIAERHGLRACFMPKPFAATSGNGCHVHLSLHDESTGANICKGDQTAGLSNTALCFAEGLLAHAGSLSAITNPTVNSYKRLHAVSSNNNSGATWAPNRVSWGGNNRSVMLRLPGGPRMELRMADMATNPYLLPAAVAAAGLSGLSAGLQPSLPFMNYNLYDTPQGTPEATAVAALPRLPGNLGEALTYFEDCKSLREHLGDELTCSYAKLRREHWESFLSHFSRWETEQYMDS